MQAVRKKLADESGVSIVFASLAMVVLFVIGGIVIAYGYNNYNRAIENKQVSNNYDAVSVAAKSLHAMCGTYTLEESVTTVYNDKQLVSKAIYRALNNGQWSDSITVKGTDASSQEKQIPVTVTCKKTQTYEFGEEYTFAIQGSGNSTSMEFPVTVEIVKEEVIDPDTKEPKKDDKGEIVYTVSRVISSVGSIHKVVR